MHVLALLLTLSGALFPLLRPPMLPQKAAAESPERRASAEQPLAGLPQTMRKPPPPLKLKQPLHCHSGGHSSTFKRGRKGGRVRVSED